MTDTGLRRMPAVREWLATTVAALALVACSGGDGGTTAPPAAAAPPPPPPPVVSTNTAPVATITTDNATPDEGQPFMVDASGSSDPDNDALTFMWTQTAGPDLEITDPTSPILSFTAPEITETVSVTFQVEVSDGELFNTATVDVQLVNIVLEPNTSRFGSAIFERQVDGNPLGAIGLATPVVQPAGPDSLGFLSVLQSGNLEFTFANRVTGLSFSSDLELLIPNAEEESRVKGEVVADLGLIFDGGPFGILYALEGSGLLIGLEAIQTGLEFAYQVALNIPMEGICAVEDVNLFATDNGFLQQNPGLFLGRRGMGLRLAEFPDGLGSGTMVDVEVVGLPDTGSLCEMNRGSLSNLSGTLGDLLAIDVENLTYQVFLQDINASSFELSYSALPAMSLADDISDNLAVRGFSSNLAGNSSGLFAVAFSNGEHRGEHRLIIFRETVDTISGDPAIRRPSMFEIVSDISWEVGIPSDVLVIDLGDDTDADVVVTLESAPFAMLLENVSGQNIGFDAQFNQPVFFEVGLGATEVSFFDFFNADSRRLLLTYGSGNLLRIFEETAQ
ncbi:MAG: hypothetical protein AAF683_14235 [Pseudomonadota bacterium]